MQCGETETDRDHRELREPSLLLIERYRYYPLRAVPGRSISTGNHREPLALPRRAAQGSEKGQIVSRQGRKTPRECGLLDPLAKSGMDSLRRAGTTCALAGSAYCGSLERGRPPWASYRRRKAQKSQRPSSSNRDRERRMRRPTPPFGGVQGRQAGQRFRTDAAQHAFPCGAIQKPAPQHGSGGARGELAKGAGRRHGIGSAGIGVQRRKVG